MRLRQVHSKRVTIRPSCADDGVEADGIMTDVRDSVLSVTVADCLPIYLDLREANIELLRRAGIDAVRVVTDCTACTPWLGSHRREGPSAFTRMLALLGYF